MSFSLLMDISILVLLAATVFLAFRLSINLRNFKESRFEMEGLVNRLTGNIDKAEKAIAGLQLAARTAGRDLDEVISDAKALSNELKIMNEAGNSLAGRLEKIADRNREMTEKMEQSKSVRQGSSPKTTDGFMIQDRDYDEEEEEAMLDAQFDAPVPSTNLQSQAERDLFDALQKRAAKQKFLKG